ncbi:hypothetical protein [Sphingobium sp.]|uniref:hypothetical protein n=1 Tax=Sphingobium sp. TaxID=1912891 RepID=UPI002C7F10CF|nr:hypothetical protein [Sphingobium sp.]HUD90008.1 hypothetical protein [Sphingobium sp.]
MTDIGLGSLGAEGAVDMCDFAMSLPSAFELAVTDFDQAADVATFTCDFPATPFLHSPVPPEGSEIIAEGYLCTATGNMPDCDAATVINGSAYHFVNMASRIRGFLDLNSPAPDLFGTSGGPVTRLEEPNAAFALLNGAASILGGPPFIFTSI